jgi:hypothetical protein
MTKKEQFLAFVLVGAIAQDCANQNNDMPLIIRMAASIPDDDIPENPMEAAKTFLAFCNGVIKRPQRWMLKAIY